MKTPQVVSDLLNKPMDRKEFLQHVAAIAVVVSGGGLIANSVANVAKMNGSTEAVANSTAATFSYGMGVYGGVTRA